MNRILWNFCLENNNNSYRLEGVYYFTWIQIPWSIAQSLHLDALRQRWIIIRIDHHHSFLDLIKSNPLKCSASRKKRKQNKSSHRQQCMRYEQKRNETAYIKLMMTMKEKRKKKYLRHAIKHEELITVHISSAFSIRHWFNLTSNYLLADWTRKKWVCSFRKS